MQLEIRTNKDIKYVLKSCPPTDRPQNFKCGHNLVLRIRTIKDGGAVKIGGELRSQPPLITYCRSESTV